MGDILAEMSISGDIFVQNNENVRLINKIGGNLFFQTMLQKIKEYVCQNFLENKNENLCGNSNLHTSVKRPKGFSLSAVKGRDPQLAILQIPIFY